MALHLSCAEGMVQWSTMALCWLVLPSCPLTYLPQSCYWASKAWVGDLQAYSDVFLSKNFYDRERMGIIMLKAN